MNTKGQDKLCYNQIDSLVEQIAKINNRSISNEKAIEKVLYQERVITDPKTLEILAITHDYYPLNDSIGLSFHLGFFFYKEKLIQVKESQMNTHFRKINSQTYYYHNSTCSENANSKTDMIKKVFYFRLATMQIEFYNKKVP